MLPVHMLTYLPIEDGKVMMILPDGKHILQVGNMLREDWSWLAWAGQHWHPLGVPGFKLSDVTSALEFG